MPKYLSTILVIFALFFAFNAHAAETKGGYGACVTESLFDEFIAALVQNDYLALVYLSKNGCIITKGGLAVSVLDKTWSGTVKIRVYLGDATLILWTNAENIVK